MQGTGFHFIGPKVRIFSAILMLLFFFIRCADKPESIGADLLPENSSLGVYDDTLRVTLKTVPGVGLQDDVSDNESWMGSITNAITGTVISDFISDYIFTASPAYRYDTLDDDLELVSLELHLVYSELYGDLSEVAFNVYEMAEPVPYYDSTSFVMLNHMVGDSIGFFRGNVSSILTDEPEEDYNTCVISLSTGFAQKFVDLDLLKDTIFQTTNVANYRKVFKGLYFKSVSQSQTGGALKIDHEKSRMVLITSSPNGEGVRSNDTTEFTLGYSESEIDEGGVHLNLFRHEISARVAAAMNNAAYTSEAYLVSPGGARVLVSIPEFDAFKAEHYQKISINRAELVLPFSRSLIDGSISDNIRIARQLGVFDASLRSPILDNQLDGYLQGAIDSTSNQYLLNVGNHLQSILTDDDATESDSLYVFIADHSADESTGGKDIEHLILNGSSSNNYPYLRIVYSKIP